MLSEVEERRLGSIEPQKSEGFDGQAKIDLKKKQKKGARKMLQSKMLFFLSVNSRYMAPFLNPVVGLIP